MVSRQPAPYFKQKKENRDISGPEMVSLLMLCSYVSHVVDYWMDCKHL